MSRLWIRLVLLCAGSWLAAVAGASASPAGTAPAGRPIDSFDLVIRNGLLLDGLGGPPVAADVAVADGRIAFVGRLPAGSPGAAQTVDAGGRVVAPGFVDLRVGADPLAAADFESSLAMGVTTMVVEQPRSGPAPTDSGVWLDQLAAAGSQVNVALWVDYHALREQAGISPGAEPDVPGIEALEAGLTDALDHAFAVGVGLGRDRGWAGSELELRALARGVGARDRLVFARLADTDDDTRDRSLAQIVRIGRHARVHVVGLRAVGGQDPLRAEELLQQFYRARAGRVRITAAVDPYSAAADAPASDTGADPALQARLLGDALVAVGSGDDPAGVNPGRYGAFARFIEVFAQSGGPVALPEAVRRMTSLPATIIGLPDRGRIAAGFAADLVIFDPVRVRARATRAEPQRLAEGFDIVIVNGRIARADGALADTVSADIVSADIVSGVVLRPSDPERAAPAATLPPGRPVSQ